MDLYIWSQVFVFFAYAFLVVSYAIKNRKIILYILCVSTVFFAVSYVFLSAWTAVGTNCISLVRNILFLITIKSYNKNKENAKRFDNIILGVTLTSLLIISIIFYDGPLSILSSFASTLSSIAAWQKNNLVYKILGIVCNICWIIYNLSVGSIVGAILEGALMISVIIFTIIYIVKNKKNNQTQNEKA